MSLSGVVGSLIIPLHFSVTVVIRGQVLLYWLENAMDEVKEEVDGIGK